jgi:uncharacterized protein YhjY with autotransporter beta-barrel domain
MNSKLTGAWRALAKSLFSLMAAALSLSVAQPGLAAIDAVTPAQLRAEVVFVESNVAGHQTLAERFGANAEVHVLDASRDGLAQMAQILDGRRGVDAVHVVSHGAEAAVQLGALTLTAGNLLEHAAELTTIGRAMGPEANLMLYGCNVAAGADGVAFVSALALDTGTVVAASTGLTGAAAKGGNWELEYATGVRTAAGLHDDAYQGVLLSATFDFEPGTGMIYGLNNFSGAFYANQTNNAAGETLNIQSFGDVVGSWSLWSGSPQLAGTDALAAGFSNGVTSIRFSLASGKRFDLTSLLALDGFNSYNTVNTVRISSEKGAAFFTLRADGNVATFDVAGSPYSAYMKDIAWFELTSTEPVFFYTFDNISLTNIGLPTVTGINPASGTTAGGTAVTITGTNFTGATAVTIGGAAATGVSVVDANTITATLPAGSAGTADVAVTGPDGTGTGSGLFTYVPPPAVTSVSPGSGPTTGGTTVTITGTGFTGTTGVTIGGAPATSVTVSSDTSITVVTPSGTAGAQDVVVSRANGSGTGSGLFTYVAAPAVSAVSPASGAAAGGTSVVITGSNFTGASAVNFGANAATSYTVDTPTQITAIAPAGAVGIVDITVTTVGGTSATGASDGFTYVAAPIVTGVSPGSGPAMGGTSVTITGSNFTGASAVNFGANAATAYTVDTPTQITATAPAGAGVVDIRVTTVGGTSATGASDGFTYVAEPIVTSVSPGSGPATGGTSITITGSNFTGATAVSIGGAAASSYSVDSATRITATTPAGSAGAADVVVTTASGSGTGTGLFTYIAPPGAPTGVSALAGDSQATISFSAPASNGGASITGYTATSSPGNITGTCAASPCSVSGLTNGTAYTFTVTATNSVGTGAASSASNSVTPNAAQTIVFANPGTQIFGTTPTLSATASSGLGVSFTSNTTAVCTVTGGGALSFVTAGTCTIAADQAGSSAYQAAPTVMQSFTVNAIVPAAPIIGIAAAGNMQATISFSAPASNGGASITGYTATSSPGNITGTCTASPCTVSGLTNGSAYTFTVTATNSAGTGAASSASNSVTPNAAQTITFANPGAQNFGTTPTLSATASSGLSVSFTSGTTAVCTVTAGGALAFVATGTCTINADQVGNAAYAAAPTVTQSFSVNAVVPAAPTIGTASASNAQASVAFSAPAFDGGAAISGYTATSNPGGVTGTCAASPCTVSGLTNGTAYTFTVTATNSAGTGAASVSSGSVTPMANVPGAPTAVSASAGDGQATVSFSAPTADGGGAITGYTATSSPGAITGTCASSPCTVTGLSNGTAYSFTVTATNMAGTGATSSASNSVTPKSAQSITFNNPGAQNFGTASTLTANASLGLGVSFSSTTTGVCTVTAAGALTFVSAGTCTINADQGGNATTVAATTVTQSFSVNAVVPGTPTIGTAIAGDTQASVAFTVPATSGGAAITGYTATASPGGITGTCATSPCTISGLSNGTAYSFSVTATNSAGTGAASAMSNAVTPRAGQTITFANPGAQDFGATPTLSATASSGLSVSFSSNTTAVCTISAGGALTTVAPGTCSINADQAGNSAYAAALTVTQTFAIDGTAPGVPTGVSAVPGNGQATVTFTAPAFDGGSAITGYTATSSPGGMTGTCSGAAACAITVSGLTNGTAYTFTVTATNATGSGAASAPSSAITPTATPVAGAASMQYQLNTAVTLDLAPYITGSGVTITAAPQHGSVAVSGTQVTYTPAPNFFGSDAFTYVAVNGGLTSAAATVSISFNGTRPDPSADADVGGLVNAQAAAAQRFARAQLFNFQQRLEWLHRRPQAGAQDGGLMPRGGALAMANDNEAFAGIVDARMAARPARVAQRAVMQTSAAGNDEPTGSSPPAWFNTVVSALTTSSLNLDMATLAGNDDPAAAAAGAIDIWGAGSVRIGYKRQADGSSNIDYTTDGVTFGADRRLRDDLVIGVGVGYAHDKSTIGSDGSDNTSDATSIAFYASYQPAAATFVDGLLGYGALSLDSSRYVASYSDFARASRSGSQLFGSLAAGYEYRDTHALFSPYLRYDINVDRLDAASESGGGAGALSYSTQTTTAQQLSLGMRGETQHETDFGLIQPRARLEYQLHNVSGGQTSVAYADLPGTRYSMAIPTLNANALLVGLGGSVVLNKGLSVDVDLQFAHSSDNEDSRTFFVRVSKRLSGE